MTFIAPLFLFYNITFKRIRKNKRIHKYLLPVYNIAHEQWQQAYEDILHTFSITWLINTISLLHMISSNALYCTQKDIIEHTLLHTKWYHRTHFIAHNWIPLYPLTHFTAHKKNISLFSHFTENGAGTFQKGFFCEKGINWELLNKHVSNIYFKKFNRTRIAEHFKIRQHEV